MYLPCSALQLAWPTFVRFHSGEREGERGADGETYTNDGKAERPSHHGKAKSDSGPDESHGTPCGTVTLVHSTKPTATMGRQGGEGKGMAPPTVCATTYRSTDRRGTAGARALTHEGYPRCGYPFLFPTRWESLRPRQTNETFPSSLVYLRTRADFASRSFGTDLTCCSFVSICLPF